MSEKESWNGEDDDIGEDEGRGANIEANCVVNTLGPWHVCFPHGSERDTGQEQANNPAETFGDHENNSGITYSLFKWKDADPGVLEQDR